MRVALSAFLSAVREYGYGFFLQKRIDSLQEAFIHPRSCVMHILLDACALFDYFWTVEQKHPTPILKLGRARIIFLI